MFDLPSHEISTNPEGFRIEPAHLDISGISKFHCCEVVTSQEILTISFLLVFINMLSFFAFVSFASEEIALIEKHPQFPAFLFHQQNFRSLPYIAGYGQKKTTKKSGWKRWVTTLACASLTSSWPRVV